MKNTFEMKLAMRPLPLCLLAALLLAGTALGEVSREGLVAYYNFENNLNDLSGEGNNGQSRILAMLEIQPTLFSQRK